MAAQPPALTTRALNRALLARQLLLERSDRSALSAIEHLVGLQAQAPQAPYAGLWSRLAGFTPDALSRLLIERQAVRVAVMRGTIHLVSAEDCLTLRPLTQPVHQRSFQGNWGKRIPDVDLALLAEQARTLVDATPMTFEALGRALVVHWPGRDPASLAQAGRVMLALVQPPPRGVWRASGAARHTTAEAWLGRPLATAPSLDDLVLRYLAAFGPASVLDAQAWSGLTRLGEVFTRLRPRLMVFRDAVTGRELFDLPDAPRPDGATPAPVRYLAEFDNALLAHADKTRIIGDAERAVIQTVNGQVLGTVLVDGFVRAAYKLLIGKGTTRLTISALGPALSKKDSTAIAAEGRRLLAFAAADGEQSELTFAAV